jgi:hypothetical protein
MAGLPGEQSISQIQDQSTSILNWNEQEPLACHLLRVGVGPRQQENFHIFEAKPHHFGCFLLRASPDRGGDIPLTDRKSASVSYYRTRAFLNMKTSACFTLWRSLHHAPPRERPENGEQHLDKNFQDRRRFIRRIVSGRIAPPSRKVVRASS